MQMKPDLTNIDPNGYNWVTSHLDAIANTAKHNQWSLDILLRKMTEGDFIFAYSQIPEDKRMIMLDKLNSIVKKNRDLEYEMTRFHKMMWKKMVLFQTLIVDHADPNRFLKKSYFRRIADHGGLDTDVKKLKERITEMDDCFPKFEKLQQTFFVEPALRKYYAPLGYKYNEFVEVYKEIKELLKWYQRLIQLGY